MKLKLFLNEAKVFKETHIMSLIDDENRPKLAARRWLQGWPWNNYPIGEVV